MPASAPPASPLPALRPLRRDELPADAVGLARYLLDKVLVHDLPEGRLAGRIVERPRPIRWATRPATPTAGAHAPMAPCSWPRATPMCGCCTACMDPQYLGRGRGHRRRHRGARAGTAGGAGGHAPTPAGRAPARPGTRSRAPGRGHGDRARAGPRRPVHRRGALAGRPCHCGRRLRHRRRGTPHRPVARSRSAAALLRGGQPLCQRRGRHCGKRRARPELSGETARQAPYRAPRRPHGSMARSKSSEPADSRPSFSAGR